MVLAWTSRVLHADIGDEIRISLDGGVVVHRRGDDGWQILSTTDIATHTTVLSGFVDAPAVLPAAHVPQPPAPITLPPVGHAVRLELGERHYRRSEAGWRDAREPRALVDLERTADGLAVRIQVPTSDLTFAAADAVNLYDNEPADINGDGVQVYVQGDEGSSGWMLVPDRTSSSVRVRRIEGFTTDRPISATWSADGQGYRMDVRLPGALPRAIDLIVNEMPAGRERRRGQLVLSGAEGEFIYLRGDRHDAARFIPLHAADG